MKRKMILMMSLMISLLAFCAIGLADEGPSIVINGTILPCDVAPVAQSDEMLVPLRAISESLGWDLLWDGEKQEITIIKGDDVMVVTIGNTEATVNGKTIILPQQPVIVEGHTILPLEFIREALGAEASWDEAKQVFNIDKLEYREDLLPEEMLAKSNKIMADTKTYKYQGNFDMDIFTSFPQSEDGQIKMAMEMNGQARMPDESYVSVKYNSVSDPNFPQEMLAQPTETYLNKNVIYQRMFGGPWQKMDLEIPGELMNMNNSLQNSSPQEYIDQIKQYGLFPAYAGDKTIEGQSYYVIKVKLDEEKYKEVMKASMDLAKQQVMDQTAEQNEGEEMPVDFGQMISQMLDSMSMNYGYKMYVNTDTYFMDRIDFDGAVTMALPEQATMRTHFTGSMNMYDINQPVEMPDVSGITNN